MNDFFKFLRAFLKFYFALIFYSLLSIVILYASADAIHVIKTGESLLWKLISQADSVTEAKAAEIVLYYLRTSIESIPGEKIYEEFFNGILKDVGGDVFSFLDKLHTSWETVRQPFFDSLWTPYAFRSYATATLAAVVHLGIDDVFDTKLGKGISITIARSLASIYRVLAEYTFAAAVMLGLETRVHADNKVLLYIIITVTAFAIKALVDAFGKKAPIYRVLVVDLLIVAISALKAMLVWLLCANAVMLNVDTFTSQILGTLLLLGLFYVEERIKKAVKGKKAK